MKRQTHNKNKNQIEENNQNITDNYYFNLFNQIEIKSKGERVPSRKMNSIQSIS